jgi:hypothetical protein
MGTDRPSISWVLRVKLSPLKPLISLFIGEFMKYKLALFTALLPTMIFAQSGKENAGYQGTMSAKDGLGTAAPGGFMSQPTSVNDGNQCDKSCRQAQALRINEMLGLTHVHRRSLANGGSGLMIETPPSSPKKPSANDNRDAALLGGGGIQAVGTVVGNSTESPFNGGEKAVNTGIGYVNQAAANATSAASAQVRNYEEWYQTQQNLNYALNHKNALSWEQVGAAYWGVELYGASQFFSAPGVLSGIGQGVNGWDSGMNDIGGGISSAF